MPFPITHLIIAERVLAMRPMPEDDAASFLLGSIAPDGVHYRKGYTGEDKKASHLCSFSDKRWGRVTENDTWQKKVTAFVKEQCGPFMLGYCTHILSDICNNRDIWMPYVKNNPEDAAKGYNSDYYKDVEQIDSYLYQRLAPGNIIEKLIMEAAVSSVPGLVTAEEVEAIRYNAMTKDIGPARENIIFVSYPDKPPADITGCRYTTIERIEGLIGTAAKLAVKELFDY